MTDPLTAEAIELLERLDREATAGPWSWERTGDKDNSWCVGVSCDENGVSVAGLIEEEFDDTASGVEFLPKPEVVEFICENGNDGTFADADLLVSLRNAATALLEAAKRANEYEAFFREHATELEKTVLAHADAQCWVDLAALLERLK